MRLSRTHNLNSLTPSNRRNSKERELLASGGSRDQTLPNKNNPNPDLSDAKADRPVSLSPHSLSPSNSSEQQQPSQQQQQQHALQSSSNQSSPNKTSPIDQKFMVMTGKKQGDFKFEVDERSSSISASGHPHIGQLFNNFYDNHSSDGSVKTYSNQSNSMYYDDYDSNSDDSEEINVT
jgi:hypothetical protein